MGRRRRDDSREIVERYALDQLQEAMSPADEIGALRQLAGRIDDLHEEINRNWNMDRQGS